MVESAFPEHYSRPYVESVLRGSRILFSDLKVLAISLETEAAAAFWSEGTNWCITRPSCFLNYQRLGPLIMFQLHEKNSRYLLSSKNCEFRNPKNRRLCVQSFMHRFPKIQPLLRSLICTDWRASLFFGLTPEGTHVEHSVNLRALGISSLPKGLSVRDDLILCENPIFELPDNLFVGGCLDIRDTGISVLPSNLTVLGSIYRDF